MRNDETPTGQGEGFVPQSSEGGSVLPEHHPTGSDLTSTDDLRARLLEAARTAPLPPRGRSMTPEEFDAWALGYFAGWAQGYRDGGER
jgi:hypothetical protein